MTMRSLRNSKRFPTAFFLGLVVLAVLAFFARGPLFSFGSSLLARFETTEHLTASVGSLFQSRESLEQQVVQLRSELDAARYRLVALQGAASSTTFMQVAGINAKVLTHPNRSIYDTLVIAAGSADGVAQGDIAVAGESVAIGVVEQVAAHTSVVTLYSSPGKNTDVLLGSEGVVVIAEGQGGGGFIARVPQDVPASLGDTIALPHRATVAFAVVDDIIVVPADPFKKVYFQNPVNIYTLQSVSLVKP